MKKDNGCAQRNMKEYFEKSKYISFFQAIPFLRLKRMLERNNATLDGKSIFIASCGWGVDLYYLKKFYSPGTIFVSDVKSERVASTISVFPKIRGAALDNHNLGLKDNSFDYVMVAASLHHLGEPSRGLYELLRVARCGLIVIEPHDCWLTRLFEKLGWAHQYEVEHGNYVYRFSKRDVIKIANSLFFRYEILRFFAMHYLGNSRIKFLIFKLLNGLGNTFFPYFGNYIIFLLTKEKILPKCMKKEPQSS